MSFGLTAASLRRCFTTAGVTLNARRSPRSRGPVIDELLEGLELIRRVHAGADHVLGEADLRGDAVGLIRHGIGSFLLIRFCLARIRALAPALAGGDEIPAGLFTLAVPLCSTTSG